jgi:Zn finger protein HypA/HybF involved in hydrogenase expression
MSKIMNKIRCIECEWTGELSELLEDKNPFDLEEYIYGCPVCKSIDQFEYICDEPGCNHTITCGFPTETGYRRTCGKHYKG